MLEHTSSIAYQIMLLSVSAVGMMGNEAVDRLCQVPLLSREELPQFPLPKS